MKKLSLLFFSIIAFNILSAQTKLPCDSTRLATEELLKGADSCIIVATNYVLSKPLGGNDDQYYEYRKFIISWMEATPEYTFSINDKLMDICTEKDNLLLFGVYMSCLAKGALEGKKNISEDGLKLLVEYIRNKENKVAQTSKVKKLIADFDAGKTEKYTKE